MGVVKNLDKGGIIRWDSSSLAALRVPDGYIPFLLAIPISPEMYYILKKHSKMMYDVSVKDQLQFMKCLLCCLVNPFNAKFPAWQLLRPNFLLKSFL